MPKPLKDEEYVAQAIANKRRRIRVLESEIAALEELVELLRKTQEVKVGAQRH